MINEIYIRNYLFVQEYRLTINDGMTIITGETGAGKSILVGSLALIFGDKSTKLEPANPSKPIYLEASVELEESSELEQFLSEQGYEDVKELIVAREHSQNGKSSYFLNGRKVPGSFIRELRPYIVDFHHQHDQQNLLHQDYQLEILDRFAQLEEARSEFATLYRQVRKNLGILAELRQRHELDNQLQDLYQFQFDELEKANLIPGEDKQLQEEFELLSHSSEIIEQATQAVLELTQSDSSIYDALRSILARLSNYAHLDVKIRDCLESLDAAQISIQEAAGFLEDICTGLSHEPDRMQKIQSRLDLINTLLFKHRVRSIEELLMLFAERQQQLSSMADNSQQIQALEQSLKQDYHRLVEAAEELSLKRSIAVNDLSDRLISQIRKLSLPKAALQIRIDKKTPDKNSIQAGLTAFNVTGTDTIEFLFSANPGSALKELKAVASGGELSRVLLAIKSVVSEKLSPRMIVLDEVDAGIGGQTAEKVADFIRELASRHRVMCVSHLAQIAVAADRHLAITKMSQNGATTVQIEELSDEDRLPEIARMLSGSITELSLLHAKELIENKEVMNEQR